MTTASLLLLAVPANACGIIADGGLHHHLELLGLIPLIGAWLLMQLRRVRGR